MQFATEAHSKVVTPYGPFVQEIEIDAPRLPKWEICHPFAFLWHLTMISTGFREVMNAITSAHRVLRLVIYADELVPGNPYRPEKSRTLMCIYWAFVDWPSWLLSRTFAWPCFSIMRSAILQDIPGGMAYLARVILRVFFPHSGESMDSGVLIQTPDGPLLIKCKFVGWLADLVGHKEITEWKGTTGNVCCMECGKLHKVAVGCRADGRVGLDCCDFGKWGRRSNADIHDIVDKIEQIRDSTQLAQTETDEGINYRPTGILFDKFLRNMYLPIDHMIRDWQHIFLQDGVANTCIGEIMDILKTHGKTHQHVRVFLKLCHLPSKYGRPHENWLADSCLKGRKLRSFSSTVLNLIPIIFLFVTKYCEADPDLADVVRCITLLQTVCGVLSAGPDAPVRYAKALERMLLEYHSLVAQMGFYLKPKVHHMHHVLDGMLWLGKLLSCFVCERKHRTVKDNALHVFRHIEHTVLADVINKQCHQMISGIDIFKEHCLVCPRSVTEVPGLMRSRKAVLAIGSVSAGDILWLIDARCGRITLFYNVFGTVVMQMQMYSNVLNDPSMFDERHSTDVSVFPNQIVDACTWYYESEGIVKIAIPPIALIK